MQTQQKKQKTMCFNFTTEVSPQGLSLLPSSCLSAQVFSFPVRASLQHCCAIYIALPSIKHQSESTLLWPQALPFCVRAPCLPPPPVLQYLRVLPLFEMSSKPSSTLLFSPHGRKQLCKLPMSSVPHCLPCQFTVSVECPWGYCYCPATPGPLSFIVGPLECSTVQKRERTHASVVSVELLSR